MFSAPGVFVSRAWSNTASMLGYDAMGGVGEGCVYDEDGEDGDGMTEIWLSGLLLFCGVVLVLCNA